MVVADRYAFEYEYKLSRSIGFCSFQVLAIIKICMIMVPHRTYYLS